MTLYRCQRCGHWWSTNARGQYICRFCPTCIPLISHQLRDLEGAA